MAEPTAVEQTINTILQKSIDVATVTGDFLKDQIPDVIKQLVTFNLVSEAFWTLLPLTVLISTLCFLPYLIRVGKKYQDETDGMIWMLIVTIACGATIVGLVGFLSHITSLLELIFAPKVWLLEYAAHLVRK